MNTKRMLSVTAALAALCLAACGDKAPDAPAGNPSQVGQAPDTTTTASQDRADPRDAPVPKVDGKPMWSANRSRTAEENAQAAFDRNGEAFGAKDVDAFVRKAHAFTANPPSGTDRIERANGDTLLYDPKGNVFAVVTKDGAPRTMFKPDDGPAYWQKQKDQTARTASSTKDEG